VEFAGGRWAIKHDAGILGYAKTEAEAWRLVESLANDPKETGSRRRRDQTRYRAMSFRTRPFSILIVENESLVRVELASRFEEMGLTPLAASNADEALALLETHPKIEVLLTDIKMPNGSMNGGLLAHHVRTRWPLVKIIVLSGLYDFDRSTLPQGSIFLTKPCRPDVLMDALTRLVSPANDRLGRDRDVQGHGRV
jgi:CheY-like chemotaxis protein